MASWYDMGKKVRQQFANAGRLDSHQNRKAAQAAYQRQLSDFNTYIARRGDDVDRALSRRISAGEIGMPYLLIDTITAAAVTGHQKGQAPNLHAAIEEAKDSLWFQCRHLGGDAVLHADLRIEQGVAAYVNHGAAVWNFASNIISSVSKTNLGIMNTVDRQATLTVFALGTAVRLLPQDTKLAPRLYEQFNKQWLNWTLPPGVEQPIPPQSHEQEPALAQSSESNNQKSPRTRLVEQG